MIGIETDRMKNWRIARVGRRTAQRIATEYVLYPASGKRRHRNEMQHAFVLNMIARLHWLWFTRVKDMIINGLWVPGSNQCRSSNLYTFRRVMNCRPSSVYFHRGNGRVLRPCQQHRFCPFCWGRVASFLYRRIKHRLRGIRKTTDGLVLYCRVLSCFIPATGFNSATSLSEEQTRAHIARLTAVFAKQREDYRRLVKSLQRNTVGSAWRVLADPQDAGWNIEVRQLILAKPSRRALPWIRWRNAKTVFLESAKIEDDEALYPIIGRFVQYPGGLLTSYQELSAINLQASYNLRLASGTGEFRACGSGLIRAFREDKKHGEAQAPAQSTEESCKSADSFAAAAPV